MKITKQHIEKIEKQIDEITEQLVDTIEAIGSTRAAILSGTRKNALNDWIHGNSYMSIDKILEIARKLFD